MSGELDQLPGLRLPAQVFHYLGHTVDAPGLVGITRTIEQRQFDAGNLGKARFTLQRIQPAVAVDLGESCGALIDELQAMPADLETPHLLGHDHLKYHGRLVRSAVKGRCAQQRDAIIDLQVLHQRVDPTYRIRCACSAVFRTKD